MTLASQIYNKLIYNNFVIRFSPKVISMDKLEVTYSQRQPSCTYHCKVDIPYSVSFFFQFLSGVLLGVPPRTNIIKTCAQKKLDHMLKIR